MDVFVPQIMEPGNHLPMEVLMWKIIYKWVIFQSDLVLVSDAPSKYGEFTLKSMGLDTVSTIIITILSEQN